MKKILALALCLLMVVSVFVGCSKDAASYKFGAGVYSTTPSTTDATLDTDGTGTVDVTLAAVIVDADGKIVSCAVDTTSNTVKYSMDGVAVSGEFMTKYEIGAAYNMVAYGGAIKEWFEQADAFETVVVGKTLDEVKALVADGDKGTDEVINAGCTIKINDFVSAVEKAYKAASAGVSANATLDVKMVTNQTLTDATEDKDGTNKIAINTFAAAYDAEGKVLAASSDCIEFAFGFTVEGAATYDATTPVLTKKEQGSDYGMVAYGGAAKEWFEQAAAFDAACVGKTTAEIAGLQAEDGKGVSDLQTAGCTIDITDFVKAATK